MHTFTLGADGCFRRDGTHFFPTGVNYRPLSCADDQDMWARWPESEIQFDLAQIAAAGLNAVRVNPPAVESHRARVIDFVHMAGKAGLAVLVAGSDEWVRDGALPGQTVESVTFVAQSDTHVIGHDGLLDPFFQSFLPFVVSCARARRPAVVVGTLGFGGAAGVQQRDSFLRATLPAARDAVAAGFFWCDWRDAGRCYDSLLDETGRVKSGLEFFVEFARIGAGGAPPVSSGAALGLFLAADCASGEGTLRRLLLAHYMLGCAGRPTVMVAGLPRIERFRQLLIPGVPVDAVAAAGLLAWVQAGGELFWHGPDLIPWDGHLESLLGARPVNWRGARGISVNAFGERFTMAHFPRDVRVELESCGAHVLAPDQQGLPVLLENRVGRGRVRYMLPIVEEAIVPVAAHPTARDRWTAWYRGMLAP